MSHARRRPCERCGILCTAQYCVDCRLVDPEMTAGGRNVHAQQPYLAAHEARMTNAEFFSWVRSVAPSTASIGRGRKRA